MRPATAGDALFVGMVLFAVLWLLMRQMTSSRRSGWLSQVLFLAALHAWTISGRAAINAYDSTGAAKTCGVPPAGWDDFHSNRNTYGGGFSCPAEQVATLTPQHPGQGIAQLWRGGSCEIRQRYVLQALIAEVGAGGSQGGGGPVLPSHGFLLGWFRDCDWMSKTDHDVDVSIYPAQWNRLSMHRVHWRAIALALTNLDFIQGLELYIYPLFGDQRSGETEYVESHGFTIPAKTYTMVGPHSGCNVDIWIRNSVNATHTIEYWPGTSRWGRPRTKVANHAYLTKRRPLRRVNPEEFWGLEVYTGEHVRDELIETYGPGWNKPVGYHSWSMDVMTKLKTKGNASWLLEEGDGLAEKCQEVGERMDYAAFWTERIATVTLVGGNLLLWALERCTRPFATANSRSHFMSASLGNRTAALLSRNSTDVQGP